MLVSLNWLKDFIEFDESPKELAERLTMAGLEVDAVASLAEGFDHLVIGHILTREAHPDSDHLTVCRVDVGIEQIQIICGAPNHRQGDKVIVALPGARLSGGLEIGPTKIRGIESFGMICSEREMGISDEAEGVLILPQDAVPGTPAAEVLGRNDTVLEIDLTPNRPDCLSHVGIAREIAAFTSGTLKTVPVEMEEEGPEASTLASVTIHDPDLCPRYTCRVIQGVTIGPSPAWMQQRLRAVGLRPINNVVDVTNYVLMEMGHPLHAFDYDLLAGNRIEVRRAKKGEKVRTLDDVERRLDPDMLLICDAEKAVAIAGVMGGSNSEVHEKTGNILLESAYFHPSSIRKTAKSLGLHSESSHRFERGTDIEGVVRALDRAASLIQRLAGGALARGRIDVYPVRFPIQKIPLRVRKVSELLGVKLSSEEIARILKSLNLAVSETKEEILTVEIPTFRVDLEREIDLIEEVARRFGYNRIPSTRVMATLELGGRSREQRLTAEVRQELAAQGFFETIHYSFHNPTDLDRFGLHEKDPLRDHIRIRNPLSEDQSVMRTTLLPGLIETLQHNLKHSRSDIRIFEVGRVFEKQTSTGALERHCVAGLISGQDILDGWDVRPREVDFFDLKASVEDLLGGIGLPSLQWIDREIPPFLHPGKSAWVECRGSRLGLLGELHPEVMKEYDLQQRAYCFELDLDACFALAADQVIYRPASRFPSVERDVALIVSNDISAGAVQAEMREASPALIRGIRLFDLYRGKPIPSDRKSLAFTIRFQAEDRTLTDKEINLVRDSIIERLNKKFGATLRE
jgi:phenylalanyl-tRNA synthetase beta chain